MVLKEKNFKAFVNTLLSWYRENGRSLPWREKQIDSRDFTNLSAIRGSKETRCDPYRAYGEHRGDEADKEGRQNRGVSAYEVWVSEIMLQQTQVSRVEGFYRKFLKRFPNVSSLSKASWETFLPYYEGLGYYNRGRNMLKTAKLVNEKYNSQFPKTKKELLALPGIGEYTANAIRAFAYDEPVLAVDTNLKRIFSRYFGVINLEEEKMRKIFLNANISGRDLNSALMDFGSLCCTARPVKENHRCPFKKQCRCFSGVRGVRNGGKQGGKKQKVSGACIFIHENHQKYFSEVKKSFRPFFIPLDSYSRSAVKAYFLKKYGLKLSVRPPFTQATFKKKEYVMVNAQILSGKNPFYMFSKKEGTETRNSLKRPISS